MAGPETTDTLESLQKNWRTLYTTTLPSLARSKDPAQPRWPVSLDHCFARIILDNTIGTASSHPADDSEQGIRRGQDGSGTGMVQWDQVIKKPAVKNMSEAQFQDAIALGERIQRGEVDLVELDKRSLRARGKEEGKYGGKGKSRGSESEEEDDMKNSVKRKREAEGESLSEKKRKSTDGKEAQSTLNFSRTRPEKPAQPSPPVAAVDREQRQSTVHNTSGSETWIRELEKKLETKSRLTDDHIRQTLKSIQTHPSLTPFRKRLYTSLLSVPRGEYTTYAALAAHLNSVARAVGNGIRNNPFAPDVPCHRVLASDRSIGGFGGDWSRDGKNTNKQDLKVKLLVEEGVKFDSTGKVKGPVWKAFWDLDDFAGRTKYDLS